MKNDELKNNTDVTIEKTKNVKVENKNRIWNKITYINFVLSLLVLILHARFNTYINKGDTDPVNVLVLNINNFIQVLADCAVPTFFCISSMLFFRKFEMNQYEEKITKRIKSLLIPYAFFSIFFLIIYIIIKKIPAISEIIWSPIKSLEIKDLINYLIYATSNNALWFVRVLMIWFVISPIVYYLLKKLKKLSLVIILFTVFINLFNSYEYASLTKWLPVLILGAYIGLYNWDNIKNVPLINKNTKIISIITLILFIIIIIYTMNNGNKIYYIYRMISPLFVWIVFDMFQYNKEPKWYFKISFFIFCMHYPLVLAQKNLLVRAFGKAPITLLWMHIVSIVSALIIIYLLAYILRKYFKKLWNTITGDRS